MRIRVFKNYKDYIDNKKPYENGVSREFANKYKGIYDLIDCTDCWNCYKCIDCTNCSACKKCITCRHCIDLINKTFI